MIAIRAITLWLIMGAFAGACSAAGDHHHHDHEHEGDHEQHSAHVHGHAKLFVVLEGNVLELLFESPAINLLGFEHKPESDQQSAKFDQVLSELNQPRGLFNVSEQAGCELSEKKIRCLTRTRVLARVMPIIVPSTVLNVKVLMNYRTSRYSF